MTDGADNPRLLSATTTIVTLLASVTSLAISLSTLVFLVRPNLRPPEKLGVTVTRIALAHNVPLSAQMEESFKSVPTIPLFQKARGIRVWIEIDVQGFQTRSYGALPQLIDVTDKKSNRKQSIEAVSLCPDFTPAASTDKVVLRCWIQAPSRAGRFVVRVAVFEAEKDKPAEEGLRFELKDPKPVLGFLDSESFEAPPPTSASSNILACLREIDSRSSPRHCSP